MHVPAVRIGWDRDYDITNLGPFIDSLHGTSVALGVYKSACMWHCQPAFQLAMEGALC